MRPASQGTDSGSYAAFASFAFAFALLILVSLIAMMVVGNSAFDILFGQYSTALWVMSTLAVSPFVYRKLR